MKSFLLYDLSSYALSTLATPGEFENGGFSLKAYQMFSVHTTPEKFHGVVFDENHVVFVPTSFSKIKILFQKAFRLHENEKPTFSNSSGLKSAFEKFRFPVTD